ncbi:fatty acid desaturase [Leeia sp.]|uniref:fatty acid desaturase n=1 Tax=Leeia sp. TaxID=2884678 RepID=UPI0035B21F62
MLRNRRDVQSLAYLLAAPLLVAWQWRHGFSLPLYLLLLFLTLGIGVINHNHSHLPMWRHRGLNRLTTLWVSLLQGHPAFVFHPAHVANHHRYHHGEQDVARTYRFGGDHNHLLGYLLHPVVVIPVLYPLFWHYLGRLQHRRPALWRACLLQYGWLLLLWGVLLWLSPGKTLLYVLLPQLHGLHWLLATNYLQHAHADGHSPLNFARNFDGLINPLLLNIGLHTSHHRHPKAHWSQLTHLQQRYRDQVDPRLNERGLLPYMFRVYLLGLIWPRYRSQSLMTFTPH